MIEINLINILGLSVIANLIAHWFTPVQTIKNKISKLTSFFPWFGNALSCSKCLGLWIALLAFHSLPAAALTSFLGYIINHFIDRIEEWYK
tara:strand:+ start:798 stop:1070 length:273 start_codon:yes stop_codon:yes gene_type:complete